jgi:cytochrome P450
MNCEQSSRTSANRPVGNPRAAARDAYYDSELRVWVLSRFEDVSAALHQPQLWPVGPNGEGQLGDEVRGAQSNNRTQVLSALQIAKVAEWKSEFAPVAEKLAASLPLGQRVDVIGEFARPWSLLLAAKVVGVDLDKARLLVPLAVKVTASTADPENAILKADAATAGAELDAALTGSRLPMAGPAFIALSQTLPCLLANAWLNLVNHPGEMERMRSDAELLGKAVDELLRLAGLARVVHRQAIGEAKIGNLVIEGGQRVNLMIEAANHDPEQFPEPDRVDLSRRATGHFALGAGEHSCVAAALIRMAVGVATGVLVNKFVPAQQAEPVAWHGGSGFCWPAGVYALRRAV